MRKFNESSSPPAQTVSLSFDEFDQFNEITAGWDVDCRQLGRGAMDGSITQLLSNRFVISRASFSRASLQQGASVPGMRSFGVLGAGVPDADVYGCQFSPDRLVIFAKNSDFRCVSPGAFCVYVISLTEEELSAASGRLGLPDPCEGLGAADEVKRLAPYDAENLRRTISQSLAALCPPGIGLLHPGKSLARVIEQFAEQMVMLLTNGEFMKVHPSPRRLTASTNLTLSYIDEHLGDGISVMDVVKATGISRRTLEYAFRKQFDMSPKSFINEQRLRMVRRDLLKRSGGEFIADIANRWGFWHIGQFARDYRKLFGELPSATTKYQ